MGRKNLLSSQRLNTLIANYENAKAENQALYLDADQAIEISNWYFRGQQYKEAQEVIAYGLELHPESTELRVEQAYLYLDTGKKEKAKQVADSITEDFSYEAKLLKAELLLEEDELEEAQQMLSTVEGNDLPTIMDVAYLYLDMGYPEAAKEWIDKGEKEYAEEEEYITLVAEYLSAINQPEQAIDYYNAVIDKSPFNSDYWIGLAKCYFMQEQVEKAIEACDFALAANEQCYEAYSYKAYCFFYLDNAEEAIKCYQKAVESGSVTPEQGYTFIGMSYAYMKDWQKANEYYQKVIDCLEADNSQPALLMDAYTNKAFSLTYLGENEEARKLCDKAKAISPNEPVVYIAEGRAYLAEGNEKEAERSFGQAVAIRSNAEIYYTIGSMYAEYNCLLQSKVYFEKVYQINPKFETIPEKLSILSLIHGEINDFLKYNEECETPIEADKMFELLQEFNGEYGNNVLQKIWEQMKKDNL